MKHKSILSAILSGCLLTLSFPRFNIEVLAWVALVPLIICTYRQKAGRAFWLGTICGVVHYLGTIYWIAYTLSHYGKLNWAISVGLLLLLVFYLGLYIGVFAGVLSWCNRKTVIPSFWIGPFLWVVLEYIRTYFLSGFPWALLGYTQYLKLPVIQLADITGVYGISFIIVLVNCSVASMIVFYFNHYIEGGESSLLTALRVGLSTLTILFILLAYGWWRIDYYTKLDRRLSPIKVAVVQGNIEQDLKWDPDYQQQTMHVYRELSQKAMQYKPQLIVWPETATPFYFQSNSKYQPQILKWAESWGAWLLFGSPGFQKILTQTRLYNSAFLISPANKIAGVYNKMHLVPFGEYIPFKGILSFADKLVAQAGDFYSGNEYTIMQLENARFGVAICFEIIFPQLVRQFFNRGAHFLVNITNDAWFGKTAAPLQHFSILCFRAVENRTYIARAANTGISGFVNPLGRILKASPIFTTDFLADTIYLGSKKSFYAEYGDIFSWMCIIVTGGWLLELVRRHNA